MPFKDNSFDFLLCNHVLEHIEDDQKAISEIYRVDGSWIDVGHPKGIDTATKELLNNRNV